MVRSAMAGRRDGGSSVAACPVMVAMVLAVGGVAELGGTAWAQNLRPILPAQIFVRTDNEKVEDPEAPARLTKIVEALASNDFKVRASADRVLADDAGITLPMLERALKEGGARMSVDTRLRLTSAARGRFGETPRAAMGIQFWLNPNVSDRVVIDKTFPRFDSNRKLEDGDMVIEADGVRTVGPTAQKKFQSVIVSHDPGDVVPITVRRGEKRLDLSVKLGRRDELENNALVDPGMLDRAWKVRSASYVTPLSGAIVPPVNPAEWAVTSGTQLRLDRGLARTKGGAGAGPQVRGGGMPRGAAVSEEQIGQRQAMGGGRRMNGLGGQIIFNGAQQVMIQNGNVVFLGQGGWNDPAQETTAPAKPIQTELTDLLRARAASGSAPDKGRAPQARKQLPNGEFVLMQDYAQKEARLLDKEIAAIRAEMAEQGLMPEPAKAEPAKSESAIHDGEADKPLPPAP